MAGRLTPPPECRDAGDIQAWMDVVQAWAPEEVPEAIDESIAWLVGYRDGIAADRVEAAYKQAEEMTRAVGEQQSRLFRVLFMFFVLMFSLITGFQVDLIAGGQSIEIGKLKVQVQDVSHAFDQAHPRRSP